jgi:hypothetical protein
MNKYKLLQYININISSCALFSFFILCTLFSCKKDPYANKPYPCLNGPCKAKFVIDTIQNRGSFIDNTDTWNIKYSGLNYFRILGEASILHPAYVINGVPLIETGYDSNFFYVAGNITWVYPLYSYLGLFSNGNLTRPIPFATGTYTIRQLTDTYFIDNLAGYQINKKFNFDHPAASTMLQTYSKYNYKPTQQMVFFREMIGKDAEIYIRVTWNTDVGRRVENIYKLKVKFIA